MSDSANCCALCAAQTGLTTHPVGPENTASLTLCETCAAAVNGDIQDAPHWKCLNDAIWSPDAATQVLAYRLLHRLSDQVWARELLEIAYLEPETLAWAQAGLASDPDEGYGGFDQGSECQRCWLYRQAGHSRAQYLAGA